MAFSSLTMKIESTAPTAVSSAQPGRTGSFKSLSLAWRAPRHQTLSSQHISPSHDLRIVSPSSQRCCHADCHPHTLALSLTPSPSHSLTLQCVSLLASRAALDRGSHQAAGRSCPNSDSRTGPAAVCSEPCRHAATRRSRLHA